MDCLTEIRQHFDPLIDDASFSVKSRFDLSLQLDGLYLRMYELFLFCFIRRATLLCQTIVNLRPAVSRRDMAEAIIRAQFVSQDYNIGQKGEDLIRFLFWTNAHHAIDAPAWHSLRQTW